MKIWEAIIYGIFGGIAELLPISFSGHIAMLRNVFHMSSLAEGGGYYVRAAICLGVILAVYLSFPMDSRRFGRQICLTVGLKKRRNGERVNRLLQRSIMLCTIAFSFMLCSLFFLAAAERIERLLYIILFFLIYAGSVYLCCKGHVGNKTEKNASVTDFVIIGLARMICVFPGLSSLGASIAAGRSRGLAVEYNIRIAYMLTMAFQVVLFIFYLIRAIAYGMFSASILLPCIFAMLFATVFGYLAIQYFRYLLQRVKFNVFVYYILEIAAFASVLALINA